MAQPFDTANTHSGPGLPQEVVTCLQNARFLHLATCDGLEPHVSLMNYTYLPSSPWTSQPAIVMTTPPASKKTDNLVANPRVSLLVHDWVAHRPPTLGNAASPTDRERSPPPAARSGLASLLVQMNAAELSRISATITGTARMVGSGSDEEAWLKARHLENNTFEDRESHTLRGAGFASSVQQGGEHESGDGGRGCYIEGDEVRVIVVNIRGGRTVDWKGGASDWLVSDSEPHVDRQIQVNGIA